MLGTERCVKFARLEGHGDAPRCGGEQASTIATAGHPPAGREQIVQAIQEGAHAWAVHNFASGCEVADMLVQRLDVALTTDRADRPAFSGEDAATELRRLASHGALEHSTTDAVLAAAGHRQPLPKSRRPQHPAGSPAARPKCYAWRRGV
jgi:hypothetical protein